MAEFEEALDLGGEVDLHSSIFYLAGLCKHALCPHDIVVERPLFLMEFVGFYSANVKLLVVTLFSYGIDGSPLMPLFCVPINR